MLPENAWEFPYCVYTVGNKSNARPEEYNWLLKGDSEPFIEYLRKHPDKLKIEWVQSLLFEALQHSNSKPKHRPATKKAHENRIKILKSVLSQMLDGVTQTQACKEAARRYHKSYDTVYKDIVKHYREENALLIISLLVSIENEQQGKYSTKHIGQVWRKLKG